MCNHPLHPFLAALPKCEHHMHLEGSLSPDLLFSLAAKNSITLPHPSEDPAFTSPASLRARYDAFTSLDDFLHYYYIGFRVLVTHSDFAALAHTYLRHAHRTANLRHAELFFDPQVHLDRGIALDTVVDGFTEGMRRAEAELGVTSLLIPCLLRHLPVPHSAACFAQLRDSGAFADGKLAGLGLCSTELDKHPSAWKDIFAEARELGIRLTAHAGEEGPAEFVMAALDELGVERVDHGVRSAESEEVLDRLAREGTMLTVCPLSNVRLRVMERVEHGSMRMFLERGVRFSINSDDPAYFGGYLLENYCAVQEAFGFEIEEWETVVRNAVVGSWCEEERKSEILAEIEKVVGEWRVKEVSVNGSA